VIGQDAVIRKLRALIRRPDFDRAALYFEGRTGVGKTSIARALANELGATGWAYTEIDGDKCDVAAVRDLDAQTRAAGLFADQWRVFVVNECHVLKPRAVAAWLTLLERIPRRWLIVFTTTEDSADLYGGFHQAFTDRTLAFRLTNQGLAERFARLAHRIAQREGLNGKAPAAYMGLAKNCRNSLRAMLSRIEAGEMLTD